MRLRDRYLALTSLGALFVAIGVPACAPSEDGGIGTSSSNLTRAACPCGGEISRGWFNDHDGVDVAASSGTPIYATQAGVVTDMGPVQRDGQWIRIQHDDGSMTEYGYLQGPAVRVGQKVRAGQQIALVGTEAESTGPHLHLRTYKRAGEIGGIDPKLYLSARGISLPCRGGATNAAGTECPGGKGTVAGAIEARYQELGGCTSQILGLPTTDEIGTADGIGRYSEFQKGVIYWKEATGAHEIYGAILELWVKMRSEQGPLGYPITGEVETPDNRGRYSVFENGSIYWTDATGAHEVRGAIRDRWKEMGWEAGSLGYPISDEYDFEGGRRSDFERGYITWNARSGAKVFLNGGGTCQPACLPVTWLADVLSNAGLQVWEDPGWRNRGNGSFENLWGVMIHHTGGDGDGQWVVVRDGTPSLNGPLAQLVLEKSGLFRVVASGVAWHAGAGSYPGLPTNDANFHTIGIEAVNTGNESWSAAQYNAYVRGVAAILRYVALDSSRVIGHKEWAGASQGKWDPGGIDMNVFRADVAALLGE